MRLTHLVLALVFAGIGACLVCTSASAAPVKPAMSGAVQSDNGRLSIRHE